MSFPYDILNITAHRPWPMPLSPWVMTQTWHDLLFAHWPVDRAGLRDKIPSGFGLDEFEGRPWLGVVPFHMSNVSPRGVPALPWISAFPELNVRTYVRVGGVPGVYFFSLDAANPVAVTVARTMFHLPYFSADMHVGERDGWIEYTSRRNGDSGPGAEFIGRYRATGAARQPLEGTLEYFLTERYCLFTVDSSFHACRVDIHHPPWALQEAEAEINTNTMAEASDIRVPPVAPLLHFAKRQDMVAWTLKKVKG
jgi:uncharacterized protein YqjF (DUF2071 family)